MGQYGLLHHHQQNRPQLLDNFSHQGHGYHRHPQFPAMGGQGMLPATLAAAAQARMQANTQVSAAPTSAGAGQVLAEDNAVLAHLQAEGEEEEEAEEDAEEEAEEEAEAEEEEEEEEEDREDG